MTATLVGSLNAGALNPVTLSCLAPASAQLQANLSAALALQAQLAVSPPTLAVQVANLEAVIATLEEGIALGLPGISFSATAAAQLVASAQLALGLLASLTAMLGGPAMYVYSYSGGTVSTLGSDLASGLTTSPPPGLVPSSACAGLLIGASSNAWANINAYFGGL